MLYKLRKSEFRKDSMFEQKVWYLYNATMTAIRKRKMGGWVSQLGVEHTLDDVRRRQVETYGST